MFRKSACIGFLLWVGSVQAQGARPASEEVAPFLDDEAAVVARIHLERFDAGRFLGLRAEDRGSAATLTKNLAPWLAALRTAGARDLYLIGRFDQLSLAHPHFAGASPPSAVVTLTDQSAVDAVEKLLRGEGDVPSPVAWSNTARVQGGVFAGSDDAVKRLPLLKPVARPELGEALAAAPDSAVEVVFSPSAAARRVFDEMTPNLPDDLGGGPITTLTRGLRWALLTLDDQPEPALRLIVQARDASAARDLERLGANLDRTLRGSPGVKRLLPEFEALAARFKSDIQGDRVTVSSTAGEAGAWASAVLGPIRRRIARADCVDDLKRIGLAMHNYLSVHGTFPPAFVADASGKPLLSWRVLILPYLEQNDLYKGFHLDEPWDGPHNKELIGRMPKVFACPSEVGKKLDPGMTTYVTLRGPRTLVPGAVGVKIKEVVDGTSNTIMTLDAAADRAVVWTKPDDLDVPAEFDPKTSTDVKALLSRHGQGSNVGLADGSVRFLKDSIAPMVWHALTTRNGGEVVDHEEL